MAGFTNVSVSKNRAPQITAGPSASPNTILDTVTSAISVTVNDPDGDALTYAWSATGGTISGTGANVTHNPPKGLNTIVHRVDVVVTDGHGGSVSGLVNITVSPTPPVVVNNGSIAEWNAVLVRNGGPLFNPLIVVFGSNAYVVSGFGRDNNNEVDVDSNGTIDSAGHIVLTSVLTNGGSARATIIWTGNITGAQNNQTFSGTYSATGPSVSPPNSTETGTFTMTHN